MFLRGRTNNYKNSSHSDQALDEFLGYQNKTIKIKCLQSIDELKRSCKILGLKFKDNREKSLEIDFILEDKLLRKRKFYYVKWKGFKSKCTWVPESELDHCHYLINYYENLRSPPDLLSKEMMLHFIGDLVTRSPHDILSLTKLLSLVFNITAESVNSLQLTFDELRTKAVKVLYIPIEKLNKIRLKLFKLMQFAENRKHYLLDLKEWEAEINAYTSPFIEVENNVDLEEPPREFVFIKDYVSLSVDLSEAPLVFCECSNCYENRGKCCSRNLDACLAYNKQGRLQLHPGYPIYECNKLCKCDNNCVNRVVQHGQKVRVSIFRTSNGCGWGLKTLDRIQKDEFVIEYLGEVITSDEAEKRGEVYDYLGKTYLFDLDSADTCLYTVDGGSVGNASHFINHSCQPNMQVFTVWINQHDPDLPRLAFFATRKIFPGEELTFDYKMIDSRQKVGIPIPEDERVLCNCNSKNCRKYLF